MIQAMIQQVKPMATQEPTEIRSRWPMRWGFLRQMRT